MTKNKKYRIKNVGKYKKDINSKKETNSKKDINNKKKTNNKKENTVLENKKIIIVTTISIIFLLCLIFVSTYAVLVTRKESDTKQFYTTGNLSVRFNEDTSSTINLTDALPTSDDIGSKQKPYTFTLTGGADNEGNSVQNDYASEYTIRLKLNDNSEIPTNNIKVKVNDNAPVLLSSLENNILYSGVLSKNESKDFSIRLWIDINATKEIENKTFSAKIVVDGKAVRKIPTEYQEVEYIESTGTQYIDTGFYPGVNPKIELELSFNGEFKDESMRDTNVTTLAMFGSGNKKYIYQANFGNQSSHYNYILYWTNLGWDENTRIIWNKTYDMSIINNKNTMTVTNNSATYGGVTIETEQTTTALDKPLVVFGSNYNGIMKPFDAYNMKLYSLKLWNDNILERYMIPCYRKSDNIAGMYDVVNNVFYTNGGTGEFNVGANN